MRSGRAVTAVGAFAAPGCAEGQAVTVAIRPQGVIVDAESETEGAAGRIMSRHFLGESDLLDVAVEGCPQYIVAKARTDASGGKAQTSACVLIQGTYWCSPKPRRRGDRPRLPQPRRFAILVTTGGRA